MGGLFGRSQPGAAGAVATAPLRWSLVSGSQRPAVGGQAAVVSAQRGGGETGGLVTTGEEKLSDGVSVG